MKGQTMEVITVCPLEAMSSNLVSSLSVIPVKKKKKKTFSGTTEVDEFLILLK